ncbi:MAG: hypothetical protein E6J79_21100 [Deltaproteobacteria bacterium]|nr:MAG: hypothetical protein E6J79_21100 [Deltaproteobacteria bacterium]
MVEVGAHALPVHERGGERLLDDELEGVLTPSVLVGTEVADVLRRTEGLGRDLEQEDGEFLVGRQTARLDPELVPSLPVRLQLDPDVRLELRQASGDVRGRRRQVERHLVLSPVVLGGLALVVVALVVVAPSGRTAGADQTSDQCDHADQLEHYASHGHSPSLWVERDGLCASSSAPRVRRFDHRRLVVRSRARARHRSG